MLTLIANARLSYGEQRISPVCVARTFVNPIELYQKRLISQIGEIEIRLLNTAPTARAPATPGDLRPAAAAPAPATPGDLCPAAAAAPAPCLNASSSRRSNDPVTAVDQVQELR